MRSKTTTLSTCGKGHNYFRSIDCPTCPICEAGRTPQDGFVAALSAPARRTLENNGITTLRQLSNYSEKNYCSSTVWVRAPYRNCR